jgi:phosphate starvation-inducible PhoH-like protein
MKNKKGEVTKKLSLQSVDIARALCGERDENLRLMEDSFGIRIGARGSEATLIGNKSGVERAERFISQIQALLKEGYPLYKGDVDYALRTMAEEPGTEIKEIFLDTVYVSAKRKLITPKGPAQKAYIDAIRRHDIVFGIGPAGTGKTYLAMAMAVASLMKGEVSRIILARPAVEAGEKLGFLPGDMAEKVNPYLRPLYDALYDMVDMEKAAKLIERGVVEVAPLAFMRGRTLNEAFIILDEAQNTTAEQMKMFLTRLGFGSKAVITGDITQIDLPTGKPSGLIEVMRILKGVRGVSFCKFSERDVVRHRLVQDIVRAYDRDEMGKRGEG